MSSCASRQLEEVAFRRGIISVAELFALAEKYFRKANKGKEFAVSFSTRAIDERVVGDFIQLRFLLENLIDEALSVPLDGEIHLVAAVDGEYIRFLFTDTRRTKTREELNQLFYPNLERMTATGEKESCEVRSISSASRLFATMTSLPENVAVASMLNRLRMMDLQFISRYREENKIKEYGRQEIQSNYCRRC